MSKSPALLASAEAVFAEDDSVVIAAFEAQRVAPNADITGAQLLKALGGKVSSRHVLSPVVLIFTVKRSFTDRGFLTSFHFARPFDRPATSKRDIQHNSGAALELLDSYLLKGLTDVRISSPTRAAGADEAVDEQRQQQQHTILQLRCASQHNLPEHLGEYILPDVSAALLITSLMVQLLRQQDGVLPSFTGVSLERIDSWWTGHREEVAAQLSSFALNVLTPGVIQVGRGDDVGSVLVSAKEAAELEELLAFFELGLGESEQFAAALQEEAAALEAANVYALLESGALVEGVVGQLRHTQGMLDDLDESLKVFDFKLRHMRDDIAAIEASNNSLERQARHNTALLSLLEGLLDSLDLDRAVLAQLQQPGFDPYKLPGVVSAAWQLHAGRQRLKAGDVPSALSPVLTQMRVVQEAAAHLDQVAARFVSCSVGHLVSLVQQLVSEGLSDVERAKERRVRVAPADHRHLHSTLWRMQPLVQVLAVLEPQALQQLQLQVCQLVHSLLKRELHAASVELRRAAAADMAASSAAGEGDYNLGKERHAPGTGSSGKRAGRGSGGEGASVVGSDSVSDYAAEPLEVQLGAAAAGLSAAKRMAYVEGSAPSLPLHEAWSLLLRGFIPFLANEAFFLSDLLLMFKGDEELVAQGPQQELQQPLKSKVPVVALASSRISGCPLTRAGAQAVEALLAGLEGEFTVLPELALRSHQVLLLPMLAGARAWQRRLAVAPAARPLVALLAGLTQRLQGQWSGFVQEEVQVVEQYEGKSKMMIQQGIKHLHVLPFITQFCLLAHDMEVAVLDGLAAAGGAAEGFTGAGPQEQAEPPGLADEATGLAAARSVRAEGDTVYEQLCPVLLSRLERLAASDPKYQERCRLENYAYLGEALRSLAASLPALQQHWQVAEFRREAALSSYVSEQLQYSKFWKLLEFGEKLEKLLKVVSPPEVSFQRDCSPAEVRSLIRSSMDAADKKLEAMAVRVHKHLGAGPLFRAAWDCIKQQLISRYEHLELLLEQCYPTTPLRPSPEELRELFRATSAG